MASMNLSDQASASYFQCQPAGFGLKHLRQRKSLSSILDSFPANQTNKSIFFPPGNDWKIVSETRWLWLTHSVLTVPYLTVPYHPVPFCPVLYVACVEGESFIIVGWTIRTLSWAIINLRWARFFYNWLAIGNVLFTDRLAKTSRHKLR